MQVTQHRTAYLSPISHKLWNSNSHSSYNWKASIAIISSYSHRWMSFQLCLTCCLQCQLTWNQVCSVRRLIQTSVWNLILQLSLSLPSPIPPPSDCPCLWLTHFVWPRHANHALLILIVSRSPMEIWETNQNGVADLPDSRKLPHYAFAIIEINQLSLIYKTANIYAKTSTKF